MVFGDFSSSVFRKQYLRYGRLESWIKYNNKKRLKFDVSYPIIQLIKKLSFCVVNLRDKDYVHIFPYLKLNDQNDDSHLKNHLQSENFVWLLNMNYVLRFPQNCTKWTIIILTLNLSYVSTATDVKTSSNWLCRQGAPGQTPTFNLKVAE